MTTSDSGIQRPAWFVGAAYGGTEDQSPRFLAEGIWENGYDDKLLDLVRSMRAGDRIAIKAAYTRKRDLPFDNRGHTVSVIAIKATGTITENFNDGKRVRVDWKKVDPIREWYFYTNRGTVWRVLPDDWMTEGLVAFAFEGRRQDIDRFRNEPKWRERFGVGGHAETRFEWTEFYEALANRLMTYRERRPALLEGLREISKRVENLDHLAMDQFADGTVGFLRDICPFTVMGLFNRGTKSGNRIAIATELGRFLGVEVPAPETFDGIPVLNPQNSWFFGFERDRPADQIDALWDVFSAAIKLADSDEEDADETFKKAFDGALGRPQVAWNLTFGLYWVRPWAFVSLDRNSRAYISKKLGVVIGRHGPKRRSNAADYLKLMDVLEARFKEVAYPIHSYPELSLEAWQYEDADNIEKTDDQAESEAGAEGSDTEVEATHPPPPIIPYSAAELMGDGCFLDLPHIDLILDRLRDKKNLILQGPPGTGKTWLAKRLAFALMGQKDERKVRRVQFHPNLSYEDFVRGWRPTGDGKLSIKEGVFMEVINSASRDPSSKYVVVIEEINRGNPAQIFGETLTLLEDSKRTPDEAIELCYPDEKGNYRAVHIPDNVYVIGTMNLADRSLALMDTALRRRFAFVNLEPKLGAVWRNWVLSQRNVDPALVEDIERRIAQLNVLIENDEKLGRQFRVGHSFVTPAKSLEAGETRKWFTQVVETELGPLLEEYWFEVPAEAARAKKQLLQDW